MAFDPNDPDTKAAIKAAVEEAAEAAKGPLDAKNRELLAELKEARKSATITPEQLSVVEAERDKLRTDLTAAQKAAKDAATAAEKAAKALEAESTVTHRLVAENGLMKALSDAGVTDPAYLEAAKAMHIGSVKIVAEGDTRKAMFGDKELDAAVKEWAAGDVGKKFVSAPNNGGGGAPGGKGGADAKKIGSAEFNALPAKDRAAKMAEGYVIADAA
jgi:multidrug efflux pump subunit AcrA (membrane-fusion protein)